MTAAAPVNSLGFEDLDPELAAAKGLLYEAAGAYLGVLAIGVLSGVFGGILVRRHR